MNNCGHSFGLLPLSRPVLNTCVRNVEPCFYPSPCLCRSGTELILNHDRLCHICCFVICAQIEKCSQVFSWCPHNGSRAVLCVFSHSFVRHPLALFSWLLRTVPAWQILPRTQVCLSRSEVRGSAHSERCAYVSESLAHFEQCESSFGSSVHSVKCEPWWFEISAYSEKCEPW